MKANAGGISHRRLVALLAALLALTLTLATRAQASYPPSTIDTIGRANLDGTGVDQNFISNPTPN